jgi:hypothetical protein
VYYIACIPLEWPALWIWSKCWMFGVHLCLHYRMMTEAENGSKMFCFYLKLTQLVTWEDFIAFGSHEPFKPYILLIDNRTEGTLLAEWHMPFLTFVFSA